MSVTAIEYLFDRPLPLRHQWRASVSALANDTHHNLRATGANLRMDWRVGTRAEDELIGAAEFSPTHLAAGLEGALGSYFGRAYCQPAAAVAFVDPTDVHFPGHRRLVHVSTLDGMIRRIRRLDHTRSALDQEIRLVLGETVLRPGLSPAEASDDSIDELALRFNRLGSAAVKHLVARIHDLLGPRQPHWWASFHTDVGKYLADGRKLTDASGLGEITEGEWLVTYAYTVSDAGLLYRPTTIEANRYPFHFVSPPGLTTGLAMPLQASLPACAEVIHYPLDSDGAERACTGEFLRVGTGRGGVGYTDRYGEVGTMRARQRRWIHGHYSGMAARQWLDRHDSTF
jgi:hypothetical protein